ncbi:propionate permease [Fusobacterium necrophorum subsp. funduliforme]|uniref:GntP family permease n=1 Tax=Fusobacterium necrophorum TaxID=859 RepID=UPI000789A864|nr:GntP family permease [Fusobacterium necrophorum]KYL01706.1 propionate permease [Fusobacterium necrophorum subsp. funduliforme]
MSDFFQIAVLFIAILLFSILAFKRISAVILGPLLAIFIILSTRMPIFQTMLENYMKTAADYVQKYFLIFFLGALFGVIYQHTHAAEAIANKLIKIIKGKYTASLIMFITGILTFGGISGFVVFFAIYPIAVQLFRESKLTRRLMPAAISAGTWTWSMNAPASPSIQNVIPMRSLGTTALASTVPGFAAMIAQIVLIVIWLEYRSKSMTSRGLLFDDPSLKPLEEAGKVYEDSELPSAGLAIIPPIVILILFNVVKLPLEAAVLGGCILAILFFYKRISNGVDGWIDVLNKGAQNSVTAILNTALVVGFAGVASKTTGFGLLIDKLKRIKMSPAWFVAITVAISAGAAGSASGGLGVAFAALGDVYKTLNISPESIHRIAAIAAGTLDSLPHQGAQITLLGICSLTHKEGYLDIGVTQILIPAIALICVCIPLIQLGL